MSQIEDVERYKIMKLPEWISVSNPGSAGYDAAFVASIADAFRIGLLHSDGPFPQFHNSNGQIFNGPSVSGKDKVS